MCSGGDDDKMGEGKLYHEVVRWEDRRGLSVIKTEAVPSVSSVNKV